MVTWLLLSQILKSCGNIVLNPVISAVFFSRLWCASSERRDRETEARGSAMAAAGFPKEETDNSSSLSENIPAFRLLTATPRPRELTGAVDLLNYYGLREYYETYCKKDIPVAISESHYLLNVVGDTEIRKGEGMELGQLLQGSVDAEIPHVHIKPFDFDGVQRAFTLRESGPMFLPEAERGISTISGKVKDEIKDKEKKHKKHKKHKEHRGRQKDKDKDKDKDKHKDRDKIKEKEKDHSKKRENGEDHSKKHHKKKRKHEGEEDTDVHKHKKKKHKHSSKTERQELVKNVK